MIWGAAKQDYPESSWFVLVIAGAVMLLAGFGSAVHTFIFLRHATRVEGKVVDLQHDQDHHHELTAPIFRFAAEEGKSYTVKSNNFSYPPEFKVGQSVKVLYSRAAPTNARIDRFWEVWGLESTLALVGSCFVIGSLARIWWLRRRSFQPLAA